MQPPEISNRSELFKPELLNVCASIETFPNSLMMIAQESVAVRWLNSLIMAVVFPDPKKPEMMLTGIAYMIELSDPDIKQLAASGWQLAACDWQLAAGY